MALLATDGQSEMWHVYELVIINSFVWMKLQGSCESTEQAAAFFGCRFTGTDYTVDGKVRVAPFRLSERSHYVENWASILDRLPAGWDEDEYEIAESPYPWCETLSDGCNCHGAKGRLDVTYCSDFGEHEETDRRERKSENVWYNNYIQSLETNLVRRDESQKREKLEKEQRTPRVNARAIGARPAKEVGDFRGTRDLLAKALEGFNGLVAAGFYCSIHGRHHAYGDQAIRQTVAGIIEACAQLSRGAHQEKSVQLTVQIAAHWLEMHQSKDCAQRFVRGDADIPNILYKYLPRELIGKGAPESLRATQLLALNDDMECNVTTMKGNEEETLDFLRSLQAKVYEHLGILIPWEELLRRSVHYAEPRLSTFIQEYLNSLVGVVSFSTDILVPTMWAHYARNTGIVVGYDTAALRTLGFELRPVVYSELAPIYQPSEGNEIRLDFVNREYMERESKAGRGREGLVLLTRTKLAEFGEGWKSLSRLLLVKGISWSYEKEVRLLVDLEEARDTGKKRNGWPVKVVDPPPEAIREIYRGANTHEADVERAVEIIRGEKREGLFVGRLSSHAFRIQKTGGVNY